MELGGKGQTTGGSAITKTLTEEACFYTDNYKDSFIFTEEWWGQSIPIQHTQSVCPSPLVLIASFGWPHMSQLLNQYLLVNQLVTTVTDITIN